MIPTVLHHMIVSSIGLMPTFFFPLKPNAGHHVRLKAAAEQRL